MNSNHARSDELEQRLKDLEARIKEKEGAETALQESEKKCRTSIRSTPGMIYREFPDRSVEIIAGSDKLCGYHEEELNSMKGSWLNLLHPDDRERVFRESEPLAQGPGELVQTYRIITKDGSVKWVEDHKSSFLTAGGRFDGIDGFVFDISKRKQVEHVIADQHRFLNLIIESIPYPFYVVDAESYEIIIANRATAPDNSWKGKTCHALTHRQDAPCDDEANPCPLKEVEKTRGPVVVEHIHFDHKGNKQNVEVHGYPIYDEQGKLTSMIEFCLDITKRKEMEVEREQLIRELQAALSKVKLLSGFLPICASCKKIRDDKGYWKQIETYIRDHSEVEFSHSICPACAKKLYPGVKFYGYGKDQKEKA